MSSLAFRASKQRDTSEQNFGRNTSQSNLKLKSETSITQAAGKAVTFKENIAKERQRLEILREQSNKSAGPTISRDSTILYIQQDEQVSPLGIRSRQQRLQMKNESFGGQGDDNQRATMEHIKVTPPNIPSLKLQQAQFMYRIDDGNTPTELKKPQDRTPQSAALPTKMF